MRQLRLLALVLIGLLLCGCLPSPFKSEEKVRIVATTGMIADLARSLGGEQVEVISLMGPGVDPHLYRPTARDIARLNDADLILFNGLHLEGRMASIFENLPEKSFAVGAAVPSDQLLIAEEDEFDPHIWHSPDVWVKTIQPLADRLAQERPDSKDLFHTRANQIEGEFLSLTAELRSEIDKIPPDHRILVTAHDAFAYFGRTFGLEVHAIQGINTTAEAGAKAMTDLADLIAERKIKAIFVESSVSPATIEALQRAVRARGHEVVVGGELYSDALGAAGTPEGTVAGMIRHNVRTLTEALK